MYEYLYQFYFHETRARWTLMSFRYRPSFPEDTENYFLLANGITVFQPWTGLWSMFNSLLDNVNLLKYAV